MPMVTFDRDTNVEEKDSAAETLTETVDKAIKNMQKNLNLGDTKGIGDLIRLLQLRKELLADRKQPSRVTVHWIDECQTKPANEE
jgi:hypothetical protein